MTRLTPVLFVAALAGCTTPVYIPGVTPPPEEVAAPAPIPPSVVPFLPPGTSSSVVFQDPTGCYLYSIERTDPPSGFPIRDGAGRPVCEGQPTTPLAAPAAASPAPRAPAAVAPAPVTPAPLPAPGPVTGDTTTIDGTPITQIPAPAPLPVPLPTPTE